MIKQAKLIILLVCLLGFAEIASCEKQLQIHQLNAEFAMTDNQHQNQHQYEFFYQRENESRRRRNMIQIVIWMIRFLLGPFLFITTFPCIWYNEKRAAIDYRRLTLAQEISVSVNPLNRDQIRCANMKLTHVSGNTTVIQPTRDTVSNIFMNDSIKIIRKVEVKEWRATTRERDDKTKQTTYDLDWHENHESSAGGRSNPLQNWFVMSQTLYNQSVKVGEYMLSQSQKEQCSKSFQIYLNISNVNSILQSKHLTVRPVIQGKYAYFPPSPGASIQDHGALRLQYTYCPTGPITLMAKTVENTFQPFPIASYQSDGDTDSNQLPACCCISSCVAEGLKPINEIDLVEEEIMMKQKIVERALLKSNVLTWLIRITSYLLMAISLLLFFSPIIDLVGYVPLIGGLLKGVVGFTIFLVVLLVCIPLWIITFSLAWLWYNPKRGAIYMGIGLAILGVIILISHNNSQAGGTQSKSSQTAAHFLRTWTS